MKRLQAYLSALITLLTLLLVPIALSQSNEAALFSLLNDFRARIGVQRLTQNESLRIAAAEQARWMTQTGQVAHSHNGSTNRTRARAAGYGSNWVAEIIFMSPNTSHVTAWEWWLQSQIHYDTIIGSYYENVGIAKHTENGRTAYVIVFGNLSGVVPPPVSGQAPGSGSNANQDASAPRSPIGLVGQDEHGYILHRIQSGETLGDLALLYGYRTWDVVLTMEAINDVDRYSLKVGEVIRIPPFDGTWTPSPPPSADTPIPSPTTSSAIVSQPTAVLRSTVTPAPSSTPRPTVWIGEPRVLEIASATPPPPLNTAAAASDNQRRSIIIALIIALGLQGALLLGIGAVYLRQRGQK